MVTEARDMLRVDGVSADTKKQLQESARRLHGKPNASALVRMLIADHLSKSGPVSASLGQAEASDTVRVEIRIPRQALTQIDARAEERFSSRNYYLASVILAHLGLPQLQGSEIEVLRRSNYELAKIGTNLNQVAKAFNTLVRSGGGGPLPEVGKKIASLRREITTHTGQVLRVLNAGTAVWETKGRGQRNTQKRKEKKEVNNARTRSK